MSNVTVLFPNIERLIRTRRGMLPAKRITPPSYDDMVRSAYSVLIDDKQDSDPYANVYFYLLQKNKFYGYMKLVEDKRMPISAMCNTYRSLQIMYDDMYGSAHWHASLDVLVTKHTSNSTARYSNKVFMNKIKNTLLNKD